MSIFEVLCVILDWMCISSFAVNVEKFLFLEIGIWRNNFHVFFFFFINYLIEETIFPKQLDTQTDTTEVFIREKEFLWLVPY